VATLFSRMRRSAAEIPWGTFARVVSESMGAQTDVAVDVAMQLREWGAHLTTNALRRWTPAISMPSPCESTDLGGRVGRGKTCGAAAIVRCDICGGRRMRSATSASGERRPGGAPSTALPQATRHRRA